MADSIEFLGGVLIFISLCPGVSTLGGIIEYFFVFSTDDTNPIFSQIMIGSTVFSGLLTIILLVSGIMLFRFAGHLRNKKEEKKRLEEEDIINKYLKKLSP